MTTVNNPAATSTATVAAAGNYMARIRAIVPEARTAKCANSARNAKRDTLEDARNKVAAKLRENKAYVLGMADIEKPDLVYKVQADGTYAVGLKYGNRWLEGVFDGVNYVTGVQEAQLAELLEALACDAEAGVFENFIKPIMKANITARAK